MYCASALYNVKILFQYGIQTKRGLANLRSMRDVHKEVPALIIANGPSSQDLTASQILQLQRSGCVFYAMNGFALSRAAEYISADYYLVADPDFANEEYPELAKIYQYLEKNPQTAVVTPAVTHLLTNFLGKRIHLNGLPGAPLARSLSPLRLRSYTDSVALLALSFAIYLGHKTIYVIGLDNSYFRNYEVDYLGRTFVNFAGLHGYVEDLQQLNIQYLNPRVTRDMADALYGSAILLRDLKRFSTRANIINVGVSDRTNDVFPRACLLS
jgi:hypothetical protein